MEVLTKNAQKSGWTAEHDAYLDSNPSFFTEFFNNLTSAMSGLIDSFFKRTTQLMLEPTNEDFNVKRDIKKFLPKKEEGGKIDYRDDDIVVWFGDITVKGRAEKITSFVYRFLKNLTHREIISTGEKFKIYKRYNLFDAFALAQKLIDAGEIEERGKGVFIYLQEEHNGNNCWLDVCRDGDGKLGVIVHEVGLGREWGAGGGALFS